MKKILLILTALILLAAPVLGVCSGWTSGFGTEADNYIKKLAAKYFIPEENIDDNFSYSIMTYMGNRTAILKVVDMNYGDEVYYKSINNLPRKNNSQWKNNNQPDHSSSQSNSGYSDGSSSSVDDKNMEFEKFRARIKDVVRSKDPAEIMNVANEMTDDYWWENFTLTSDYALHTIESTILDFLWSIGSIPNMYDIYTGLITDLTQRNLETPLQGEPDAFVYYVKNDKNVNVDNAIQFLESLLNDLPNINFTDNRNRSDSKDAIENIIKDLKEFKH